MNVNKQNEKQLWWQMYWLKEPYVKKEKKKKQKIKFNFGIGDSLELLTLEDLLNVLMIQNGQVKFLKFQDDSFVKINLFIN